MMKEISAEDKRKLEEIRKSLAIIGSKEATFIKVELLFFEALSLAREYGDDENENKLLASLRQLQANQYQATKALHKKSSQREQVIKRFISQLKIVLSASIKVQN